MKNLSFYISIAIVTFVLYSVVGTAVYTYRLAEFLEIDWSFEAHGLALNGRGMGFGDLINISDIEAVSPGPDGGTTAEWCPSVQSERGFVTMSFVGDLAVCCNVHDSQYLVPFRDREGYREYFCGEWPSIDIVRQPLSATRISVDLTDDYDG